MRKSFTLLEMMVVMAIAMIMMGLIATGYQKIKRGQDLSMGASAVQGALQTARAQAMQLNKVVYAYFLDGGKYDWDFGLLDSSGGSVGTKKPSESADGYLRAFTAYDVPYDVWLVTSDGQEISHNNLPNGVAWLSLGFGAGSLAASQTSYKTGSDWYFSVNPTLLSGLGRNCSLIVAFSPTGTAWPISSYTRDSSLTTPANTLTNIRVFLLYDFLTTPAPSSVSSIPTALCAPDFWMNDTNKGGTRNVQPASTLATPSSGNTYQKNLMKMKWLTVVMNYTTGLCYSVDGLTGESW